MEGRRGPVARVLGWPRRAGGGEEAEGNGGGHGRAGDSAIGDSPCGFGGSKGDKAEGFFFLPFSCVENGNNVIALLA